MALDKSNKLTMTPAGTALGSTTADFKYGGTSMYFPATNSANSSTSYIRSNALTSSSYNIGLRDFTFEYWFKCLDYSSFFEATQTPLMIGGTGGSHTNTKLWILHKASAVGASSTNRIIFHIHNGSASLSDALLYFTCNVDLPNNNWHHIAFVRQSGTLTGYANGVSVGSRLADAANGGTIGYVNTNFIQVGGYPVTGFGYPFKGYIDDMRMTLDVARYTGNFDPPASAPIA